MQALDIQNILAKLTRSIGETPYEIQSIAESGSARKYFRIITWNGGLIGTYSNNVEENEAFLTFSKHFHDLGLNVPEVFAVNAERTCYLQSDFGDDNLFAHVQKALMVGGFGENVIQLYKQALCHLVKLQVFGHKGLDYSKAYPTERFDRQSIIDDLNYLKYYFVKPHEEIDFNETRLGKDFEAFANFVSQAPCDFFCIRPLKPYAPNTCISRR